ncbi:hypothetical protein HYPSUDRAFT_206941 [Hypholoma sublateritium FD-334 SS-4]|uniref:Uncharacterized protein n=1 Tax=Hypholoma sublateritium (strain FD-334 SS-4) TaxID=945553 RepID=A0A0D2KPJ0_HYPSF|nr:hypothetical protein HYPSUDRAFT_206941 [Hypholoma sublateritium FD-334 SS-4]
MASRSSGRRGCAPRAPAGGVAGDEWGWRRAFAARGRRRAEIKKTASRRAPRPATSQANRTEQNSTHAPSTSFVLQGPHAQRRARLPAYLQRPNTQRDTPARRPVGAP